MIAIYTVAFNEEIFIQFMIDHYRERFPNCHIVVYDNISTDDTAKIAKDNDCEVIPYETNETIDDAKYLEIKNNCWKNSKNDWVLCCDIDELLDIDQESLLTEESKDVTIVSSEGWNMVNLKDNYDLEGMKHGSRCRPYDKSYLFNSKLIKEINYQPGCHKSNPIGTVKYSDKKYLAYHYKCINPDFMEKRYEVYRQRLSAKNKQHGWGNHYNKKPGAILNEFKLWREGLTKIR